MELPFAVSDSSPIAEPSVGAPSMYDNVRLSYFTPSAPVTSHLPPSSHPAVVSSQTAALHRQQHSKTTNQNGYTNTINGVEEDEEDYYVAVDEDSFINLGTQTRTSDTGTAFYANKAASHKQSNRRVLKKDDPQLFDILELLLDSGSCSVVAELCDGAAQAAATAYQLTRVGDLTSSVLHHIQAAHMYREAALKIKYPQGTVSECCSQPALKNHVPTMPLSSHYPINLVYNLLLLCQTHAHHAQALLQSGTVVVGEDVMQSYWKFIAKQDKETHRIVTNTETPSRQYLPEDGLRATIRASMTRAKEADLTESTFLGPVTPNSHSAPHNNTLLGTESSPIDTITQQQQQPNPIDDMMKLEKELRDMDMTINLGVGMGTSMTQSHYPSKDPDVSYCILPSSSTSNPLGASFMTSSSMWVSHSIHKTSSNTNTSSSSSSTQYTNTIHHQHHARARADRVKASAPKSHLHSATSSTTLLKHLSSTPNHNNNNNLDASWWGHASILASSTVSLGNSIVGIQSNSNSKCLESSSVLTPTSKPGGDNTQSSSPITTKQLLQLLDTIRTLGDENASLLHEVDVARKAQMEAKATREAMKVFQEEYGKRFATLKSALEQYQREHPNHHLLHPVHSSSYAAAEAELRKKEETIEKLTVELCQEKEESKKKDSALRKYENFYKEVKARSAQKAKERQEEKNKNSF